MITLSNLNRSEALRYMGAKALNPDKMTSDIMDEVESELLKVCRPAYTFTEIPKDSPALGGNDIKEVVAESEKVLLIAATLGIYVEKLLRKTQITDMAKAVVVDAMASVAIEQFMDKIEDELKERYISFNRNLFLYDKGQGEYNCKCYTNCYWSYYDAF